MNIREPALPPGWYPRSPGEVHRFLDAWKAVSSAAVSSAAVSSAAVSSAAVSSAAVSPHAGWYYSGAIAAAAFSALNPGADTVVILGGHLAASSPILAAMEDAVRSPLGLMEIDLELRKALLDALEGGRGKTLADRSRDNTVEVLVPMAHFFFPHARLLSLRLPADLSSYDTGQTLARAARARGRNLAVVASTDLTHYGENYGFSPHGQGAEALAWVRELNDRRFIDAVLSGDPATVLSRAEGELSACSAGAVLGAMGFLGSDTAGPVKPELLAYGTSADAGDSTDVPDSFVGYAAIAFTEPG
jgi:AmmeMemoRadiSam system protein B